MKTPSIGTLSFGFVGATVVLLLAIGAPNSRVAPPPAAPTAPPPPSVSARGFSLASTSVDLPTDEGQYPAGPHADVINANPLRKQRLEQRKEAGEHKFKDLKVAR